MSKTINPAALEKLMAEYQATEPTEAQCKAQGVKKYTGIFMNSVYMAPQFRTGSSQWAQWLREGRIQEHWVIWAWEQNPNSSYRHWLGIRLDSGEDKAVFIDLTTKDGQDRLKALEAAYGRFLAKRDQAKLWVANILADPTVDTRVAIEEGGWTLRILEWNGEENVEIDILYSRHPENVVVNLKERVVTLYF